MKGHEARIHSTGKCHFENKRMSFISNEHPVLDDHIDSLVNQMNRSDNSRLRVNQQVKDKIYQWSLK